MHAELIDPCEVCGGSIDTNKPGHFKSPDERFRHEVCHESGEPPEGYVWEWEPTDEHLCCENHQYHCGHLAYGPRREIPAECPECN